MKKLFFSFILIAVILLLASCEGGTTFTKTIDNQSSESVTIRLYLNDGVLNEHIKIRPGESKEIYWMDRQGLFVDDSYSCTEIIDSVELLITNYKLLTKDILDAGNWVRKSKDGRNSREDCLFIISDADLQ